MATLRRRGKNEVEVLPQPQHGHTSCSSASEGDDELDSPMSPPPAEAPKKSSADLLNRSIGTFVMCLVFVGVQHIGQTLGIVLVLVCQVLMFSEIMNIRKKEVMEKEIPGSKIIPWYMFSVCLLFTVSYNIQAPLVRTWPWLDEYLKHSLFIAFSLYMLGIIAFVLSLKPNVAGVIESVGGKLRRKKAQTNPAAPLKQIYFRYQFSQFGWLHMGLLVFGVMSSYFFTTMMEGMIWFTLPVSCIVHNDSWAYACGKLFGSMPLIPTLSPKKTWEGFLGAWFFTTLWAFWYSDLLSNHKRFICPKTAFLTPIDCEVGPTFLPRQYVLPEMIASAVGIAEVTMKPVQLHAMAFAGFSSLFAPFGGFFASGLKRAFNLKDFGDLIPGHGGMIDRMDCQILMALFVYVYFYNFVTGSGGMCSGASGVVMQCLPRMTDYQKQELFRALAGDLGYTVQGAIASPGSN
eukprot:TRINITY_DN6754_c0_g1_i2.p1 TRINITY_DN6754_c0_g1~~TRINITY_DN6754_c0_g1_i2.p1  ORF type:complete len:486 (+),score=177.12 TRINITY_DN6754_c0_g1_i2:80-1459(+)